jgi:hypothetical protein
VLIIVGTLATLMPLVRRGQGGNPIIAQAEHEYLHWRALEWARWYLNRAEYEPPMVAKHNPQVLETILEFLGISRNAG